jgi:SpoIID/LytB domain protein
MFRLRSVAPILSILTIGLAVAVIAAGCSRSSANQPRTPSIPVEPTAPIAQTTTPTTTAPITPTAPTTPIKQRPALDHEPQIGVLLAQGEMVSLTLLKSAVVTIDGRERTLPAGPITVTATGNGLRIEGVGLVGDHAELHVGGDGPHFRATALAPGGQQADLTLIGEPEVHLDPASRKAQLVERIGMDSYLGGVLAKEMADSWPREALKAQAIVARSYASDRYLQNWDRPWQLHWHYTVDMAYPGWRVSDARAQEAVQATRGEVLFYYGLPLPALFHASSGGRTASIEEIKPNLKLADGHTDPAPALAPIDDTAAKEGAKALNLSHTHWQWATSFSLNSVESDLHKWAATHPGRPEIGDVKNVRIAEKNDASRRVTEVAIVHRLRGKDTTTRMSANEFRLAIGPVELKSTYWLDCYVKTGRLYITGRGFGHGVGLSQVSAWYLAKSGVAAEAIVKRFYPAADLKKAW